MTAQQLSGPEYMVADVVYVENTALPFAPLSREELVARADQTNARVVNRLTQPDRYEYLEVDFDEAIRLAREARALMVASLRRSSARVLQEVRR